MYRMKKYCDKLFRAVHDKRLWLSILGETGKYPILLVRNIFKNGNINLLIAAGFHGEEIAGPLGILEWLEASSDDILNKVNLSFLPCVSPTGFNRGIRYNSWGEKTNQGFFHKIDKPSKEGLILLKNKNLLLELAKDGFLSLHEDITEKRFYVYSYEDTEEPTFRSKALRDIEAKYFEKLQDGIKVNEESDPEATAKDGIIHKLCDGSLEDYFMHKGIRSFVTETPGKCRISRRIDATKAIINEFIRLAYGE